MQPTASALFPRSLSGFCARCTRVQAAEYQLSGGSALLVVSGTTIMLKQMEVHRAVQDLQNRTP